MSKLYDLAIAFGNKTPPPGDLRAAGTTWKDACGALTNQFALYIGGWDKAPSNYGATSVGTVYTASVIKSKNPAAAPINAKHWFKLSTGAWHVFTDLNGGGTDCLSASGRAAKVDLGNYLRIQSVAGYLATGGATYMGWSTDYAGATSKYVEPVAVLGPQQRRTGDIGAKVRSARTLDPATELSSLKGNFVYTMSGWARGATANGTDIWFRHEFGWSHSSGFDDRGTHDLADLNDVPPAPIVTPPVVVAPTPTTGVTKAEFQAIVDAATTKVTTAIAAIPKPTFPTKREIAEEVVLVQKLPGN